MAEVKGNQVRSIGVLVQPGDYAFFVDSAGAVAGMNFMCPCGCGDKSALCFSTYPKDKPADARWIWNGSREAPTLTPSILRTMGCKWHGFLTDGIFKQC